MEGENGLDYVKKPLLKQEQHQECMIKNNVNGGDHTSRHRYSFTSLKNDFFSKLPLKVQPAIDPESPFDLNLSRTSGLIEGKLLLS